jgi:hypothetical protein
MYFILQKQYTIYIKYSICSTAYVHIVTRTYALDVHTYIQILK